ncbi:MAG: hypothetical protein KDA28_05965, partial [Phycisphaerales bacterium]|nr:hypothetical protein [Phycisphaerales bacterium]
CDVGLVAGAELEVVYDPGDPMSVAPTSGYDPHPELGPVIGICLLFSFISAFFLWPDPKPKTTPGQS